MDRNGIVRDARRLARRSRAAVQAARARHLAARVPPAAAWPPGPDPDRLVPSPVFLLSSVRSGSTLLRVVLDTHPDICAPHEMHLRKVRVELTTDNAEAGVKALGLSPRDLENLLWDRVMHLQLAHSGKDVIVDKTPQNVFEWERLLLAWPQARYLVLLRHPVRIYESMRRAWPDDDANHHMELVDLYARELAVARRRLPNLTVRYEDFVADPERGAHELCDYLGVPWEPAMLDYTAVEHGAMRSRLGDWSPTLRSGTIRPPAPPPPVIPPTLQPACELLGYT